MLTELDYLFFILIWPLNLLKKEVNFLLVTYIKKLAKTNISDALV